MRLHDISKGTDTGSDSVLTEEQLKKLQKVLLIILDDFIDICKQENLKYVLIGGSAIGTLRHGGFIPWDDDVDIAMTRRDYELLKVAIRNRYANKYTVSDAKEDNNYGRIIPKIRLKNTTYRTVLERDLDECGVRLDIFVIENTYDDIFRRYIHGFLCMFFGFALSCKRLFDMRKQPAYLNVPGAMKLKQMVGAIFSFADLNKWAKWTDQIYSMCKNDNSSMVSVPTDGAHFFGELTDRDNLCERTQFYYEGRKVFLPKSYDSYLRRIYGDYMMLPPKEKRLRSRYLEYNLGKYDS